MRNIVSERQEQNKTDQDEGETKRKENRFDCVGGKSKNKFSVGSFTISG